MCHDNGATSPMSPLTGTVAMTPSQGIPKAERVCVNYDELAANTEL